jgi:hypothetical protein
MQVQIKLIDIFRDYLPPGSDASKFMLEVGEKDILQDIFSALGIPDELPRVVFCNGFAAQPEQPLRNGDLIAIFSPPFGG